MSGPPLDLDFIARLFTARAEDGALLHSTVAVEDTLAVTLMGLGVSASELPPPLRELLSRFALRVGVTPGEDHAATSARVDAYLAAHPLPPALVTGLRQGLHGAFAGQDARALGLAFERFVDLTRTLDPGPPPEGALPGGALGFFAAKKQLPPKPKKRRR